MDVKNMLPSTNSSKAMNEFFTKNYALYANKAAETAKSSTGNKKSGSAKKTGFVRATGRDSVETLRRMLMRLDAKFREVNESDVDSKLKEVFLMDIRREMNNLEGLIREVKMKEIKQSIEESKEKENERKRRTESKSLLIKRGYLYSIKDGGFDPSDYMVSLGSTGSSVPSGGTLSGGSSAGASAGATATPTAADVQSLDLSL